MPLLFALLLLPLLILLLMPLILLQRYRAGTARRLARGWIATVTLAAMMVSVLFFISGAALTNVWIPSTLIAAAAGISIGMLVGFLGLALTRWEATPRSLHYTPNRWIVLAVTLVVSVRVIYGLWHGMQTIGAGSDASFVAAVGVPQSIAAGGLVLGYYLAYALGLRRKIRQWERRPLRVI